MTRSRHPQTAFSAGEVSPLLYARQDYQRYQTGLRTCSGFLPMRQGGITRAPGTIHRGATKGNAAGRLVPFEFSEADALTLEFTPFIMRVWRYGALVQSGGVPYELATPYGAASIERLDWVQSADVIYLVDGELRPQKLSRLALDSWTIAPVDFENGPFRARNIKKDQTITASAATGAITLTAANVGFAPQWVGTLIELRPDSFEDIPLFTLNTGVAVGDLMRHNGRIYEVTAGTNTGAVAPSHVEGVEATDKTQGTKWRHVSDGVGIVRVTAYASPTSVSAQVIKELPSPVVGSPVYSWSEGAWSTRRGYPKAIEIFSQRLCAAFTPQEPRTIWFSTLGALEDFEPSAAADGSFSYAIAGGKSQNGGQWLREGKRGLYIGALGEVRRGFSSDAGQTIGPTTFDTALEATDGASAARPIAPYGFPILITKEGKRVQELRYSLEEDGGKPLELSLPSEHLGAAGFREITWQSAPQRIGWVRRGSDGLVAMIYDPDEDVLGWAPYPMAGGVVESMAVSTDAATGNDILTMIVRRQIDGQTVRLVEDQAVTWGVVAGGAPLHEAVHYFAAAVFDLEVATDSFSVPHLAGMAVHAWTNQGDYGPIEVPAGGVITLPLSVTHAVIGLYDASHHFETLNTITQAPDGDARGRLKRLHAAAGLVLHRTAAGRIQSIERDLAQATRENPPLDIVQLRVLEDLVTAYSGSTDNDASSGHAAETSYRVRPHGGAPLTLLGLVSSTEEAGA